MERRTSNLEPRTLSLDELPPRVRVLGGLITPLDLHGTVSFIMQMVRRRILGYVCVANVHTTTLAARDQRFRTVLDCATAVVSDGMPVVWRVRAAGYPQVGRVYGADLVEATCAAGLSEGVRHGFFGGLDAVGEAVACGLRERHPPIQIAGVWNPGSIHLGEESPSRLLDEIDESGCDILWVGLGAPKQEVWMAKHRAVLRVPVLVGVGQAFDILGGRTVRPPQWMGGHSLEWLYRLVHDPRRLWKRYAIYNSLFVWYLLLERFGRSHQALPPGGSAPC